MPRLHRADRNARLRRGAQQRRVLIPSRGRQRVGQSRQDRRRQLHRRRRQIEVLECRVCTGYQHLALDQEWQVLGYHLCSAFAGGDRKRVALSASGGTYCINGAVLILQKSASHAARWGCQPLLVILGLCLKSLFQGLKVLWRQCLQVLGNVQCLGVRGFNPQVAAM